MMSEINQDRTNCARQFAFAFMSESILYKRQTFIFTGLSRESLQTF